MTQARITAVGCSWCHHVVEVASATWPTCPECGHRADVARLFCDCPSCRRGASVRLVPLDLADAAARPLVLCGPPLPAWLLEAVQAAGLRLPTDAPPTPPEWGPG